MPGIESILEMMKHKLKEYDGKLSILYEQVRQCGDAIANYIYDFQTIFILNGTSFYFSSAPYFEVDFGVSNDIMLIGRLVRYTSQNYDKKICFNGVKPKSIGTCNFYSGQNDRTMRFTTEEFNRIIEFHKYNLENWREILRLLSTIHPIENEKRCMLLKIFDVKCCINKFLQDEQEALEKFLKLPLGSIKSIDFHDMNSMNPKSGGMNIRLISGKFDVKKIISALTKNYLLFLKYYDQCSKKAIKKTKRLIEIGLEKDVIHIRSMVIAEKIGYMLEVFQPQSLLILSCPHDQYLHNLYNQNTFKKFKICTSLSIGGSNEMKIELHVEQKEFSSKDSGNTLPVIRTKSTVGLYFDE